MKSKIIIAMFSGLLAGSMAVSAQGNPPVTATAAESAATNATGAATSAATQPAVAADTTASATGAATTTADSTPAVASNAVPVIPLIVMDEVPLTDAVKNLARQANINYMLDPRIAYGQPGPDGKIVPQPTVSIRWENITAEQALSALLANHGLQLLDDPKTHIARVTIKDPAAPDPLMTKIIQLKFASPSNILASVQTALTDKRSKIMGDTRTSQLVVLATEKELDALDKMVERLDLPTKQVLIEAKLLETSMNPSTIKGIDWAPTLAAQHIQAGNNLQTPPTTLSDNKVLATAFPKLLLDTASGFNPATAFLDADGLAVVLHFINQNSEAKVISTPRTVTLDNETATLSVTRASPIINVTAGTANTTGGSQITYTNLGVILTVTPRISANNYINLHIIPEVSRVFDTVRRQIGPDTFEADQYDVRKIETRVMIPSGNTLVLGGLIQDDTRETSVKVPLLGDIPFLGYLFRMDEKRRAKNNLMIFITPTIVQDSDFQPTQSTFLKTPPPENTLEKDWSAWDTGKPYDWSKIW